MKSTHTHKGHCQACGRLQAVDNETKLIAKHGYKVAGFGYFAGTCQGSDKKALELDKTFAETIILSLRDYIARQRQTRDEFQAGTRKPEKARTDKYIRAEYIGRRTKPGTGCYEEVPFAEATQYQQERAVRSAVDRCVYEMKQAEMHIDFLSDLIVEIHGKDLRPNKELGKKQMEPGDTVLIYGTPRVIKRIEPKVARSVGPYLNGQVMDHIIYESEGKEFSSPKRFARWPK